MTRGNLVLLLILASMPLLACVSVKVESIPIGNYTLLKLSYVSGCSGDLRIVLELQRGKVYSVSGNVIIRGNEVIFEAKTFPMDTNGFDLKVVGKVSGEVKVYLNGQLLLRHIFGPRCLEYTITQAPYGMYFLGYLMPSDVTMIGINVVNKCNSTVRVTIDVSVPDNVRPLETVRAIKCLAKKQYVELVPTCLEYRCTNWITSGYVNVYKITTCKRVEGEVKCKTEYRGSAPVYACLSRRCVKSTLIPKVVEVCLKTAPTFVSSSLSIKPQGFSGVVELPPHSSKTLKLFFKGEPSDDVFAKVKLNTAEVVIKKQSVHVTLSSVNWSLVLATLTVIGIAIMIYVMSMQ